MNKFTDYLNEAMSNLTEKGAFLTSADGDKVNTMTISWGNVGFEWRMPIFVAMVRQTRFTKEFIDKSGEFTVTIPLDDSMKSSLAVCGSKSGRDIDKIKECSLELMQSEKVNVPFIKTDNSIVIECRVVYKNELDVQKMDDKVKAFYNSDSIHTMYYGEILSIHS